MWNITDVSTDSDQPALYRRIIRCLENAVATGHFAAGERLPSERTLAGLFGVNRSTVIRALEELAERGLVIRKRGSGTYVNPEKWGVQTYASLTWQVPPAMFPRHKAGPFHREAELVRERANRGQAPCLDLSGDDLASDLLPALSMPENAWQHAVSAELGEEAAHLGLPALRESIARFLQNGPGPGLSIPTENVLVTSGSRQAIFLITQCLLRPGDAVGVEAPSYFYSLPVFQAAGLRMYALPTDGEGVMPEGLEAVASRRTLKMLFLNPVFHNPTGTVMGDDRKKAILSICAKARIPIVEDDAYSHLYFDSPEHGTSMKYWDTEDLVLYLGSLSSYAGRNVRAGWLTAPPGVITRLAQARHMMDAGLSVLPQLLALEYLDRVASGHLALLRKALCERAARLASFLETRFAADMVFKPPRGGLYLYATIRERDPDAYKAAQEQLLEAGVIPAIGEDFGDKPGAFRFNCSMFRDP